MDEGNTHDDQATEGAGGRAPSRRPIRVWLAFASLALVVGGVAYTNTDDFRARVRVQLEDLVDSAIPGTFRVAQLEGSLWGRLLVRGVEVSQDGETLLSIESMALDMDWSEVFFGRLGIARIEIESPRVRMHRQPDGGWDLIDSLSSAEGQLANEESGDRDPGVALVPVEIGEIAVHDGSLYIDDGDGRPVEIGEVEIVASGSIHGRVRAAVVDTLRARIEIADRPRLELAASGRFRQFRAQQRVSLERIRLSTSGSSVSGFGELRVGEAVDLTFELERIDASELALFVPALDFMPGFEGRLRASGPWTECRLEASIDWATARAELTGHTDLSVLDPVSSTVSLRFEAPELSKWIVGHRVAGSFSLEANSSGGQGRFETTLRHEGGSLDATGALQWSAEPSFELAAEVSDFDLASILPEREEWRSRLAGTVQVQGRGRDLATLRADVTSSIGPSRFGSIEIAGGGGRVHLESNEITFEDFEIDSGAAVVSLTGHLSPRADGPIEIAGRADVQELGPLLRLVGREGSGSVEGEFRLTGRIDDARLSAQLDSSRVEIDANRVGRATLGIDLAGLPTTPFRGSVSLSLNEVTTSWFEGNAVVDATGSGDKSQRFELSLSATDLEGRAQRLALDGIVHDQHIESVLREASFDLFDRTWRLDSPTAWELSRESISVDSIRLRSEEAEITAEGTFAVAGPQQFDLALRSLPIQVLTARSPTLRNVAGELDFDLGIGGTAREPRVDMTLESNGLTVSDEPVDSLVASARVEAGKAVLEILIHQAADRRIVANGTLPIELAWSQGFVARPTGELDFHASAEAFDLAFLESFADRHVDALSGHAALDLQIRGAIDDPRPTGRIDLMAVAFLPRATNVPIENLSARITIDRERVSLEDLRAVAGAGTLRATGEAALGADRIDTLQGSLVLDQWPLIDTKSYRLVSRGVLKAGGTAMAPYVEGDLEIVEGTLRPALEFLIEQPPARDASIVFSVEASQVAGPGSSESPEAEQPEAPAFVDRLGLDVHVRVDRNLWIKHAMASIELGGDVTARKPPGAKLRLVGNIATQRGWVNLQGRRFQLAEGELEFTGGDVIDPAIGVLARYKTPPYTISAKIGGVASAPTFDLSSEPPLEQADVLSVLLVGKPLNELSEGEQASLGDQASSMASTYGMTAAGKSIANALGLEEFGLQIEKISHEQATVGAYVGQRTFVSVTQQFGAEQGQEFSVEYEFWPGWSIVTSTDSLGTSSADVFWKIRY